MPQHDDQMDRRRAKREAMRKKQQAEARKLKLMLMLAALVLVLCGVGILNLVRNAPKDGPQALEVPETVPTTQPPQETLPIQQEPTTTIHIRAAGDLNITDTVVDAGLYVGGYDYSSTFKDVATLLADGDITVMNFEGNIIGEPYGTATSSAPEKILKDLRSCGVDMLQMANSCIINNGMIGMTATLNAIRNAGLEPLGAYANESEYREGKGYTIAEVKGVKIAFVAFTKGLGGRGMPQGSENLVNLLYEDYATEYKKVDEKRIEKILDAAAAENPDVTVALLHWGSEYNEDISSTQKKIVNLMKENGVDVILGTHPHTLQPIDYDSIKGTLVAYSLGDFFGDADRGATNYSIILDVEITKDNLAGTTKVTGYDYFPIYTVKSSEGEGSHRVVRIQKAMDAYLGNFLDKVNQTAYDSMEYALKRVEERLKMPEEED